MENCKVNNFSWPNSYFGLKFNVTIINKLVIKCLNHFNIIICEGVKNNACSVRDYRGTGYLIFIGLSAAVINCISIIIIAVFKFKCNLLPPNNYGLTYVFA